MPKTKDVHIEGETYTIARLTLHQLDEVTASQENGPMTDPKALREHMSTIVGYSLLRAGGCVLTFDELPVLACLYGAVLSYSVATVEVVPAAA